MFEDVVFFKLGPKEPTSVESGERCGPQTKGSGLKALGEPAQGNGGTALSANPNRLPF